jgi:hypothetical protein
MKWLLAVVAIAVLGLLGVASPGRASPPSEPRVLVGRWQIVQGPPTGLYRTFLLDSVTGESFIICGEQSGPEYWCPIGRAAQKSPPMR